MKNITRWVLPLIVAVSLGVPAWCSFVVQNGSITGAKLAASAADGTTLELSSGHLQIKDGGVTAAKRAALNRAISSSSGSVSVTGSYSDMITTGSITTTGRPVMVVVHPDGNTSSGQEGQFIMLSAQYLKLKLVRTSTALALWQTQNPSASQLSIPAELTWVDTPAAGTYTYKIQALCQTNAACTFYNAVIEAFEL